MTSSFAKPNFAADLAALKEGIAQSEAGEVCDAKEALREIAAKHGLQLDR